VNYRHIYHAGNFADVMKHAVLALVIEHLKLKPAPFRVIDTHAGTGLYDLASVEAQKTGEWRDGIGRLLNGPPLPAEAANLLAPYLAVVKSLNPSGEVVRYPGSPLLARRLMRHGDQLIANELHPEDVIELRRLIASEEDSKVMTLDGYVALKALLPPKERRGLVLIDPPFEATDELERLAVAVSDFLRRFATGTLLIWYPIKDPKAVERFHRAVAGCHISKGMIAELMIRSGKRTDILNGCGLVIVNGPYTLQANLERILPHLASRLELEKGGSWRIAPLVG
jgi:23S rRNA (adenine2030-N6)-methyltransferase